MAVYKNKSNNTYAHMLPSAQSDMANKLNIERGMQNVS